VRYLLADEVGLGKTIEAGLIMRELKLRGLVKRTLVIAPKGLVSQWVSEMRFHFGETFQLVLPEDIKTLKRIAPVTSGGEKGNHDPEVLPANAWQMFSQVVVPWIRSSPWTSAVAGPRPRWASTTASGSRT
jgi:SNF2 family DNA or RNA helicase